MTDTTMHRQLLQLERAIRHVRLQAEAEQLGLPGAGRAYQPLSSDLGDLLGTRASLSNRALAPYEPFFKNVRCGYPTGHRGNTVSVTQFAHDSIRGSSEFAAAIGLDVNLSRINPAPWVTLETPIDISKLQNSSSVRLTVGISFRTNDKVDLGHFSLAFRGKAGSEHHDYFVRNYPAFEVPLQLTYLIDTEDFAGIPLDQFESTEIVIFLPANRPLSFRCYLSFFELESVSG